jgi:hypothetical protein|tara:strand:+ start:91 stop:249 length:159 start_codon:yes stop_codon:yes gene_type:complete
VIWFFLEYPILSGIIYSVVLGLPSGLAIIWSLREFESPPEKDKNLWDEDWDL